MSRGLFPVLDIRDPLGTSQSCEWPAKLGKPEIVSAERRAPLRITAGQPLIQRAGALTRATSSMTICDATAPLAVLRTITELAVSGSGTGR